MSTTPLKSVSLLGNAVGNVSVVVYASFPYLDTGHSYIIAHIHSSEALKLTKTIISAMYDVKIFHSRQFN